DLRVMSLAAGDGGKSRVVYKAGDLDWITPAGWTPDSRAILAICMRKDQTSQLVLIGVADGSARVIRQLDASAMASRPSLSADGRYAAYEVPTDTTGARDIRVFALDGSIDEFAVRHPADDFSPV